MRCIYLAMIPVLFSGCAGKYVYTKPTPPVNVENKITVKASKNEVWKKLIANLSSSFFVINNMEKESGFINLSYNGDPEKYIDCGTVESEVSNIHGTRKYKFPAATQHATYELMPPNGGLYTSDREMKLEGRINILVNEENDVVSVSVNTRYIVTRTARFTSVGIAPNTESDSMTFNTNGSGYIKNTTFCYPTGALEKEILASIN